MGEPVNSIDIRHPHALSKRQARTVLETIASEFSDRHGAGYRWEDDTLVFSRFGMRGSVELLPGEIHVRASLGFVYLSRRDTLVARVSAFLAAHEKTKDPKVILAAARRYAAVSAHDRPAPIPAKPKPAAKPKVSADSPPVSPPEPVRAQRKTPNPDSAD